MEDFFQEKPKPKNRTAVRSHRRLFLLILAIALLWQMCGFIHTQLAQYHRNLAKDFKVMLIAPDSVDNAQLGVWGESLSAKTDIEIVRLFSPQDGLAALQQKNPRFAAALVTLGREPMPAYFELRLTDAAINNIQPFVQNIAAEYPQLSVKYAAEQAAMIFYSGLCLRVLQFTGVLALLCFVLFMFLVEAYPSRAKSHSLADVLYGLLGGVCSLAAGALLIYPSGLLMPALQQFTSVERQLILLVFCGLMGWTLGKWQKF